MKYFSLALWKSKVIVDFLTTCAIIRNANFTIILHITREGIMYSISYFWDLSYQMYHPRKFSVKKRRIVFFLQALTHRSYIKKVDDFFQNYLPLPNFLQHSCKECYDVLTRVFLYKNSTMKERLEAIVHHFMILQEYFSDEVIAHLYTTRDGYTLWQSADETLPVKVSLRFDLGQRKEGFLSLYLYYQEQMMYHFNFRFDYDREGKAAIYIGTIQGATEGLALTRELTKKLFGYRPKGFLLYMLRLFAQTLGIQKIYAISDEGFYTNSHLLRGNRSKKTELNPFWFESGAFTDGEETWYLRLPTEEKRRTYDEIKSQKRNLFRKRYRLLDTIAPAYVATIRTLFKNGVCPTPSCVDEALVPKSEGYDPIGTPKEA